MKRKKLGFIISLIWIGLIIGIVYLHTEVILKDKTTKQQDHEISVKYIQLFTGGLIVIWSILYLLKTEKKQISKKEDGNNLQGDQFNL